VFALCTAIAEALGNEPGGRDALDRDLAARGCDGHCARRWRAGWPTQRGA
jgi:hypothetical protein